MSLHAIRLLILQSEQGRISSKGALDILRGCLPRAAEFADKPRKLAQWRDELLEAIAAVTNPHRPERREPRAKKRRPKTHQLLTKPRHEFQEIPHRDRYREAAESSAIHVWHFITQNRAPQHSQNAPLQVPTSATF